MTTGAMRTVLAAVIPAVIGLGAFTPATTRAAAGQAIAITSVCRAANLVPAPGFPTDGGALQGSFTFKVKNIGSSLLVARVWAAGWLAVWDGKGPMSLASAKTFLKPNATQTFTVTLSPLHDVAGGFEAWIGFDVNGEVPGDMVTTQKDFTSFAQVPVCGA